MHAKNLHMLSSARRRIVHRKLLRGCEARKAYEIGTHMAKWAAGRLEVPMVSNDSLIIGHIVMIEMGP